MQTRQAITTFLKQSLRRATEDEQRSWLLLKMLNETRQPDTFVSLVIDGWWAASQQLAQPADEWLSYYQRDERVMRAMLEFLSRF